MRTESQIVDAQPWQLQIPGRYFRLMECGGDVRVRLMKSHRIAYEADNVEAGFWSMPDGGFDGVEVVSLAGPQLVKIGVSDGTAGYDRYTGDVNLALATGVSNTGALAVGIGSTLILAADASRKGIRFLNSGANVVYLGGAGVDLANGCLKLNAGDLWVEGDAPAAAWYAIADGGPGTLKVQELR